MTEKPSIRDKRPGETHLQWRSRVARLDAIERDRSEPLVTPEDSYANVMADAEAAQQIKIAHEIVTGGVSVRGASLEARVDNSGAGRDILIEQIGLVRIEMAYTRWRLQLPVPRRMFLDMVTSGQPLFRTARRYGMGWPRASRLLIKALDRWIDLREKMVREVDERDVENAHKRVGGGVIL